MDSFTDEITQAANQIMIDEGLELKPYRCTSDALTIGYGRNLDSMGIRQDEAELMLRNDVKGAMADAMKFIPLDCWDNLSTPRRSVIINMAFNLGLTRLSKFKNFRQALTEHEYPRASVEMMDSRWARQVGNRAVRLSEIMSEFATQSCPVAQHFGCSERNVS